MSDPSTKDPDKDAIEAAAQAMCDDELWPGAWIKANEVEHKAWVRRARAAIAAYEAACWQPISTPPPASRNPFERVFFDAWVHDTNGYREPDCWLSDGRVMFWMGDREEVVELKDVTHWRMPPPRPK